VKARRSEFLDLPAHRRRPSSLSAVSSHWRTASSIEHALISNVSNISSARSLSFYSNNIILTVSHSRTRHCHVQCVSNEQYSPTFDHNSGLLLPTSSTPDVSGCRSEWLHWNFAEIFGSPYATVKLCLHNSGFGDFGRTPDLWQTEIEVDRQWDRHTMTVYTALASRRA